jgi:hypothetical protein
VLESAGGDTFGASLAAAAYELADGPKALAELEARATVGKLALLP